ncbi:cytochrome P450 [Mycobacterium sp. M1]|uniref:Cytochrome P450 n=1 Tax=Mycolicibacter acidiphilus TaxID=2835306 RepID=A0ABS5RDZ0_9MYCO|nr:cytochrome P450 [Mycolicibacter acidiphilus]MBS9532501.1 cytochrome P450 [Mycolicibacter acidiphilus]
MTAQLTEPVLNPYDYDFHEDPFPYYARLREEAPVYHNEELNFWALSRHADVLEGFRDDGVLSNSEGVSLDPISRGPHAHRVMSILAMDDPGHLRLRTLVSRAFTPRRIRELEPQVLALARGHLDDAMALGDSFDFIGDFASKLPMDVISELMGVPSADRIRVRDLADGVLHREEGINDVPPSAMQASVELMTYYASMIADFKKTPADNLTSALLSAEIDGDRLTDEEIMAFLFLMVIAGNETTTKLLGTSMYWAHQNPDQLSTVFADPSRIPLWVEESLRYDTPSQILARKCVKEFTLHGVTVPADAVVLLLPGSGNRDGRVFDEPDEFRIGRDIGAKLLSFGSGAHFCLGAHLARMEARIVLEELFARIDGYEIDEANAVRVHSSNVRGFANLPLTVTRKAGA